MQLKIIDIHGSCRGRPPNKGSTREGPGNVKFKVQSSKFEFIEPLWPRARGWPTPTHPGLHKKPPGGDNQIADNQHLVQKSVLREWYYYVVNRRPPTADRRPESVARDWPDITCSVKTTIAQNRNKDRLKTSHYLPENGGKGELYLLTKIEN
jgi:hypothetical protein